MTNGAAAVESATSPTGASARRPDGTFAANHADGEIHTLRSTTIRWLKRIALVAGASLLTLLAVRVWDTQRGLPLSPWHTHVLHDMRAPAIATTDWAGYLRAEQALFDDLRREVTERLPPEDRVPSNRYFDGSPIYPGRFRNDWNRSYTLAPSGPVAGSVVLLHGLTDSPYSLRHVARRYVEHGYRAVAIRLPGHGTLPSGLSRVAHEDWNEATRLAVREAQRDLPPGAPMHIVGFSNGGALAMNYALDALADPKLPRPARVVLISPMIGVTSFARFAGVMGWPAVFPTFAKASWLGIVPEFNPFKYNSFPVNGARQSSLVSRRLQAQITRYAEAGKLAELPPIVTFQSVVDFTVSTRAIVDALYVQLPANGSELVLFDINRAAQLGPLLRAGPQTVLARLLPPAPRNFRTAVVTNEAPGRSRMVEVTTEAGATDERRRPIDADYPHDVFSLSHLALPFPMTDPLYGMTPDDSEDFGVNLGAIAARGERGTLVVSIDSLVRTSSNPFFDYMIGRIDEGIARPAAPRR